MHQFLAKKIHEWYAFNKRDLPWRDERDPYPIWLSEIIMQQTRIEQGTPYYHRFLKAFPTVHDLAIAKEDDVLRLWQGLGYYSRARNLHASAKLVVIEFNGEFPKSASELSQLKGVGDYTAAAIASMAYDEEVAAIDGNVTRVISRLFNITEPTESKESKIAVKQHANKLIAQQKPSDHNQALMDFGSLLCTPRQPDCRQCPLQANCHSFQHGTTSIIPNKAKKTKKRDRYFHFAVVIKDDQIALEKRDERDIWAGLWQFPMIEKNSIEDLAHKDFESKFGATLVEPIAVATTKKHVLSHQNIYAKFYLMHSLGSDKSMSFKSKSSIDAYALPRLIDRFLDDHNWLE